MKKYYIIYSAIGVMFLLTLATVILNPNADIITRFRRGETAADIAAGIPTGLKTSTLGDVVLIIFMTVCSVAVIASVAYVIYGYIKRNKKSKPDKGDSMY